MLFRSQDGMRPLFPEPTHNAKGATVGYRDRSKVICAPNSDLFQSHPSLAPAVTVLDAISDLPPVAAGDEVTRYEAEPVNAFQRARRKGSQQLTMHAATAHGKKMLEIIRHSGKNIDCIPKHLISSGFSSCYSRLCADEPSVTLTVNFVHPASNRCIHPVQHRALTAREGARIQSFDDKFVFAGNRTQVVKQIGNAVPPLLGRAIAESISKMLG